MAVIEEERDGRHQESSMVTKREWRNSLNSCLYCSIVPSVSSTHISTYTWATQTVLTWELQ